ncbi:MAG: hypothetical protein LKI39_06435 [Bacteroides sp.]|jgi:hypothetical protein|nr:hypothetical protein [Bacteroides sp.]MCI1682179.1 hypothetical protein [Bacteroides sp.]
MKKIVFLSLFALCLPWSLSAQSIDDDLYYIPSKNQKEEKKAPEKKQVVVKSNAPTTVYTSPGNTTVIIKDRKGNIRDVDEYNRRYTSKDNNFSMDNDTLYVEEKPVSDPDGEWVNGFDGSEDDYEYALRLIRFRNPRFAVSISSPLYWDIVYGSNSWDWNVYTDGMYAYAFPTFTNRLWWDWRYNSYGWGGYPYYGWNNYGWGGWYNDWSFGWGGFYGGWGGYYHHHYSPGYYGGGGYWGGSHWSSPGYYTNRRSFGSRPENVRRVISNGTSGDMRRGLYTSRSMQNGQVRRGTTTVRRVVGTRSTEERSGYERTDAASSRRTMYTRPSSTRNSSYTRNVESVRSSASPSERSSSSRTYRSTTPTYSRGSSDAPSRSSYSGESRRSSSTPSYNNSRSYDSGRSSYSSGNSSRSSGSSYSSGGGSSRSSGSTRSSGGGSTRRR